jgi:MFS family permease
MNLVVRSRLRPLIELLSKNSRQPHTEINLLYAARCARGLGDGFAVIILPAYLSAVGLNPVEIGLIATASLLGTALLTLLFGFVAPRHDLRSMLLLGAGLMAITGAALANAEQLTVVAIVSFFGTINPSTGDIGVLVPMEHASLARGVADKQRTQTFARYSLIGALSTAAGALMAGVSDLLVSWGFANLDALRIMFYLYGLLGVVAALLYFRLPRTHAEPSRPAVPLGPSRHVVYKLAALFSLDAFAGGFVVQSLLALWLFEKFALSVSAASVFFFWAGVLSAFSYPVAARIAGRIGLINTMVFTHIPSSICLIVAAFATSLPVALGLLLVRSALSQMDVPTRTSYVMAVVTPPERTAAASVTAVPRSLASSISPALTGVLLTFPFSGMPLVFCGTLKIVYDIALLFFFRHTKPPEEIAGEKSEPEVKSTHS